MSVADRVLCIFQVKSWLFDNGIVLLHPQKNRQRIDLAACNLLKTMLKRRPDAPQRRISRRQEERSASKALFFI